MKPNPFVGITNSLEQPVVHMAHHLKIAGLLGWQNLFNFLKRHFCCASTSVDLYAIVKTCIFRALERIKYCKNITKLKLFPATGPQLCVSIDFRDLLFEAKRGGKKLEKMKNCFSKLSKTLPARVSTAPRAATVFSIHWFYISDLPSELLADNGKQFTPRYF